MIPKRSSGEGASEGAIQNGANSAAAPSISLPKGGGAIRGIGEKFSANPVTGTGSMSVPISTMEATPIESQATSAQPVATLEGTIKGTVAYMSPEQAEGRVLDVRSDIFSFGSVLYEMVTGRHPFSRDSAIATLSAILKEEPQPLAGVPPELERIIRHCLRKDPTRRFQHMDDVRVELNEFREDSERTHLGVPPAASRRPILPLKVWVVAAVGAAIAMWAVSRTGTEPVVALTTVPLTTYPGAEIYPSCLCPGS